MGITRTTYVIVGEVYDKVPTINVVKRPGVTGNMYFLRGDTNIRYPEDHCENDCAEEGWPEFTIDHTNDRCFYGYVLDDIRVDDEDNVIQVDKAICLQRTMDFWTRTGRYPGMLVVTITE